MEGLSARETADASQSQLLAILYRFEGSDEKRLIRTKIDVNEGLSADALRQHLLGDGVDVNAYRARVFDEHFKAYSTVRDDQFSVDALRVVEPGPSTPQAHAIEVLLEPQHRTPPPQLSYYHPASGSSCCSGSDRRCAMRYSSS